MIDLHTHVLPHMDDGSQSPAQSLEMLQILAAQGVEGVVATPHFQLQDESLAHFLSRRDLAMAVLEAEIAGQNLPRVLPGAEVRFSPELNGCGDLARLCLGGSNALLLELPMSPWDRRTLSGACDFIRTSGLAVVLAHVERYARVQNPRDMETLSQMGALMQADAEFFLSPRTRRKALQLLRCGRIHLVASDCHNPQDRPPNLGGAMELIARRLGSETAWQLEHRTAALLRSPGEEQK